ncbi:hypothetical protein WJX72_000965 [[Myrmecia] bisecta]|uniref:FAD-binding domain-containing protein n=1 Tax=[Myrmecia] bisecta TaxID=41462 RepID=A0AAW1PJF5_9CHLO
MSRLAEARSRGLRMHAAASATSDTLILRAGEGKQAVVVGAGPAGSLMAMYLAQRGYQVKVYERRSRPQRDDSKYSLRSYPMVISQRALKALAEVGAAPLCHSGPPAQGIVLLANGGKQPMASGARQVDRVTLGADLITEAQRLFPQHIQFLFGQKLADIDFQGQTATVTDAAGHPRRVPYDLLIGADGASSRVRDLMEQHLPGFSATTRLVAKSGYKTVHGLPVPQTPADANGLQVADMAEHPPGVYLYGMRKPGAKVSATLWKAREGTISGIMTGEEEVPREQMEAVLDKEWPQLPQGWRSLILDQTDPSVQQLNSFSKIVECRKFHGPRVALVGDAAHAVTSAMGQGCNTALETCRVLNDTLVRHNDDIDAALPEFSSSRVPDAHALQDLEYLRVLSMPRRKDAYKTWPERLYARMLYATSGIIGLLLFKLLPKYFKSPFFLFARLADPSVRQRDIKRQIQLLSALVMAGVAALVWALVRVARMQLGFA